MLDDTDLCIGCGRRLDEIAAWPRASRERRLDIIAAAALRLAERQASDTQTGVTPQ